MTGITVSAYWPASTCYDSMYGIFVGSGGNLVAKKVAVEGAGVPLGDSDVGCQGGVGIEVGSARVNEAGAATLTSTTVSGYQKNGITAAGNGTTMVIKSASVLGRGPITTAETGRSVLTGRSVPSTRPPSPATSASFPAPADRTASTIPKPPGSSSTERPPAVSVKNSTISGNDVGVYYALSAATEPTKAEATLTGNSISHNPDEQIVLDQGVAAVNSNTIGGSGLVGIEVLQYNGQTYAPLPTATKDTISGQGVGVKVYSDQAVTGDLAGTFRITNSQFLTGNTTALQDNSANYTVYQAGNS